MSVCECVTMCVCVCTHACMCSVTHQRVISSACLSTLYETGFCVTVLARLATPKASYKFPLSASHLPSLWDALESKMIEHLAFTAFTRVLGI